MCAKLLFDSWRHGHDDVKVALVSRAHHAKVEVDSEIFGLFSDLVPAAQMGQGGELGIFRATSGKVPDLSYRLPIAPAVPAGVAAATRPQAQGGLPTSFIH